MTMQFSSLEILEQAQFPPTQARAIARVLEAEFATQRGDLATKSDIARLETATKSDIARLETSTRSDIERLETITKSNIAHLEATTKLDMARLETKLESNKAELVRWVFLAMIGQVTLSTGIMYFLLQTIVNR